MFPHVSICCQKRMTPRATNGSYKFQDHGAHGLKIPRILHSTWEQFADPACLPCQTRAKSMFFPNKKSPNFEYSNDLLSSKFQFLMAVLGPKAVPNLTPAWQDSAHHVVFLCSILSCPSCPFVPAQFTDSKVAQNHWNISHRWGFP